MDGALSAFDGIGLAILLISGLLALVRGFVREALSVTAFVAASLLYGIVGVLLSAFIRNPTLDVGNPYLLAPIAAAVLATGTAAGSAGTLDFLQSERPVVVPRGWSGGTALDLGRTPDGGMASIDRSLDADPVVSRRISRVERMTVPGTMSIAELVSAPVPE